MKLSCQNQN